MDQDWRNAGDRGGEPRCTVSAYAYALCSMLYQPTRMLYALCCSSLRVCCTSRRGMGTVLGCLVLTKGMVVGENSDSELSDGQYQVCLVPHYVPMSARTSYLYNTPSGRGSCTVLKWAIDGAEMGYINGHQRGTEVGSRVVLYEQDESEPGGSTTDGAGFSTEGNSETCVCLACDACDVARYHCRRLCFVRGRAHVIGSRFLCTRARREESCWWNTGVRG